MTQSSIKIITGTCGGIGSWISNPLSNAGPGYGSIQSLPPYSSSSPLSPSSFAFPGILQKGGGRGSRTTRRSKRRKSRSHTKRRTNRTRKY
jgi:hypothetical protein